MTPSIKNVSIKDFKCFLSHHGLKQIRISSGHEVWSGKELTRPVIFQTNKDPIPLFIVKSNLKTMGMTLTDLRNYLNSQS
ncbi:MAG: hypothetical protein A2V64_09475 [Bacteroidetes bacterium RBG_13_43_22]|nr:MAG: hypothetical protein A2V64_09475 [Bacteroidetes bacterium RBG_13_43_22]